VSKLEVTDALEPLLATLNVKFTGLGGLEDFPLQANLGVEVVSAIPHLGLDAGHRILLLTFHQSELSRGNLIPLSVGPGPRIRIKLFLTLQLLPANVLVLGTGCRFRRPLFLNCPLLEVGRDVELGTCRAVLHLESATG
jgi:hypothetical protein